MFVSSTSSVSSRDALAPNRYVAGRRSLISSPVPTSYFFIADAIKSPQLLWLGARVYCNIGSSHNFYIAWKNMQRKSLKEMYRAVYAVYGGTKWYKMRIIRRQKQYSICFKYVDLFPISS